MKQRIVAAIASALLLGGCAASHHEVHPIPQPSLKDNALILPKPGTLDAAVYRSLRQVPIPFPKHTPFDAVPAKREIYLAQFREGWFWAISGAILRGTYAHTAPRALAEAAYAGWQDGCQRGSARWLQQRDHELRSRRVKADAAEKRDSQKAR